MLAWSFLSILSRFNYIGCVDFDYREIKEKMEKMYEPQESANDDTVLVADSQGEAAAEVGSIFLLSQPSFIC